MRVNHPSRNVASKNIKSWRGSISSLSPTLVRTLLASRRLTMAPSRSTRRAVESKAPRATYDQWGPAQPSASTPHRSLRARGVSGSPQKPHNFGFTSFTRTWSALDGSEPRQPEHYALGQVVVVGPGLLHADHWRQGSAGLDAKRDRRSQVERETVAIIVELFEEGDMTKCARMRVLAEPECIGTDQDKSKNPYTQVRLSPSRLWWRTS